MTCDHTPTRNLYFYFYSILCLFVRYFSLSRLGSSSGYTDSWWYRHKRTRTRSRSPIHNLPRAAAASKRVPQGLMIYAHAAPNPTLALSSSSSFPLASFLLQRLLQRSLYQSCKPALCLPPCPNPPLPSPGCLDGVSRFASLMAIPRPSPGSTGDSVWQALIPSQKTPAIAEGILPPSQVPQVH